MDAEFVLASPRSTLQERGQAHHVRGRLRAQAEDMLGALEDYDASLAVYPGNGQGHLERAMVLARLGELADARVGVELALTLGLGSQDSPVARQLLTATDSVTPDDMHVAYEALIAKPPPGEEELRGWARERQGALREE